MKKTKKLKLAKQVCKKCICACTDKKQDHPWSKGWKTFTGTGEVAYQTPPAKEMWKDGWVRCKYYGRNRKITSKIPDDCPYRLDHIVRTQSKKNL